MATKKEEIEVKVANDDTRIEKVDQVFPFIKQKTEYDILTCDWSSDVCSSDYFFFSSRRRHTRF